MKLAKPVPILPALILAACYGSPSPPPAIAPTIALPPSPGWGQGIDLATEAGDVSNELQGSGIEFVARYYRDSDSHWPPLSPGEAQRLSSQGLKIVAVWESHSDDPAHFSYASGYGDAIAAYAQARAVGQPAGSAIYFAVDFNAPSWTFASINDYFRGVAAGLAAASGGAPLYRIGVYGSGAVCDAVKGAGLAQYSWLSNSITWDDATSYADWNIMQGQASPGLSFNQDSDEARGDYGGFQVAGDGGVAAVSSGALTPQPVAPRAPQDGQALTSELFPIR